MLNCVCRRVWDCVRGEEVREMCHGQVVRGAVLIPVSSCSKIRTLFQQCNDVCTAVIGDQSDGHASL